MDVLFGEEGVTYTVKGIAASSKDLFGKRSIIYPKNWTKTQAILCKLKVSSNTSFGLLRPSALCGYSSL